MKKYLPWIMGITVAILVLVFFGIPTDVIENNSYKRMIPAGTLEFFFLISTSILFGIYVGLLSYIWIKNKKRDISVKSGFSGLIGSFFAISCPVCIYILVLIFGSAFLMKYYDPIRPFLGFLSIGLIVLGIYNNFRIIKNRECSGCKND